MDNNLKKIVDNELKIDVKAASSDEVDTYFQLKKMKKKLDAYDDESSPISYGDGHSGWNR